MASPYFLTWNEALDQLLSFLPASWRSNLTGKVLKRLLVAISLAIESLYALLARVTRLSIIATSEGAYLRALVGGIGMEAHDGVAAQVMVRFERYAADSSPITISQGVQLGAVNGQIFTTTIAGQIGADATFIDLPCQCSEAGTVGNIRAGEIISLITPVPGVDVAYNPNPATGGSDSEADAAIKARVPGHLASLHRATIPATEYAIAADPARFPDVRAFITQRNYGTPGYFRGVLADVSGGDLYRITEWADVGGGVYRATCNLPEVNGLVMAGWPCKRFGIVTRSADGEERWEASLFVTNVEQGDWRYSYDTQANRIYARADGRDLNTVAITVVSGPIWRALRELELNWTANGVFCDVIAPFVASAQVSLSYTLEPDYVQIEVERSLRNAVGNYVQGLGLGQDFELEGLYAALAIVPGAGGVIVTTPADNVSVASDAIFRLSGIVQTVRRSS